MRILDTHLHLVYPEKLTYPWLANAPAINRPWSVEDYFAEATPLGITSVLHMEVDVAEPDMLAETALVGHLDSRVIGAIAACRPELAEFPSFLETVTRMNHVRGLRRILHEVPDDISQTPLFAENLRRLAEHGLSFDLCLRADQLRIGMALVDQVPDVQFILDHCGVPKVADAELDPWRADISAFAERPNVAGKISGIVAYAKPEWTVDDLRPFAEHMIESFGWDRVVWGSDHPVSTPRASLTQWVAATHEITAGASEAERAKLLYQNAERIYRVTAL